MYQVNCSRVSGLVRQMQDATLEVQLLSHVKKLKMQAKQIRTSASKAPRAYASDDDDEQLR